MAIFDVIKQYRKNKLTMKRVTDLLSAKGFYGTTVYRIEQINNVIEMEIGLPPHKEMINVKTMLLRNLQQEFMAEDSEISKVNGKFITMRFGTRKLYDKINWHYKSIIPYINTLNVEFPSSYGNFVVDFEKDTACHGLIAGTPGYGKSVAVIYILNQLYLQNSGDLEIHISSVKLDDFYPFFDCKNVHTSENAPELLVELKRLKNEAAKRKKKLRSLLHANDSKSVKKLYPHEYKHFKPIFIFIDEFARFSSKGNEDIVALVEELLATTRYLNIHIFLITQRPDALNVLTPIIRMCLAFRLCFYVENKNNSELALGRSGAEHLPKISGRGILIDKEPVTIQMPYLDLIDCYDLLKPFRKCENNEIIRTRQADNSTPEEVQSNVEGSIGDSGMSESCINERTNEIPGSCDEQNSTTFNPEWLD